jgi:Tol biopolymer transport system component
VSSPEPAASDENASASLYNFAFPAQQMNIGPGTRLGPYQIEGHLGAGGMGEVYRGRDTRLDRPVAIKVLARELGDSEELRERFEREARLLSSLNHPHICVVFDVGRYQGLSYLVMELLQGETLAARLTRGPLSVRDATSIALQIGSALDGAHRMGIVHRDVKPENVMLTRAGAKLLDFGLAKPVINTDLVGRTKTLPITAQGTILGTLQYMSPEQLEGQPADERSDIFAFGAVLFEMITGKRAFEGTTPVSVISAILRDTPPAVIDLHPFVPPALDAIIRTCLEKNPDERWQSTHDLASQLRWIQQSGSQPRLTVPVRRRPGVRELTAWGLAVVSMVTAAGLAVLYLRRDDRAEVVRFSVTEPAGALFNPRNMVAPAPAVSPDGRHVVFTASVGGRGVLILRALDSVETRVLPGSESASFPFWSADSRTIGFFADGVLKKTGIASGDVHTICKLEGVFEGASWSRENVILFSRGEGGLLRVSGDGGEPVGVTTPDASRRERYHLWPEFLPDGQHFVFLAQPGNGIFYGSLDGAAPKRLLTADAKALYAPPGHLLFARDGSLFAQTFDGRKGEIRGEPVRIATNVRAIRLNGRGAYSVSQTGVLVYRAGDARAAAEIRWIDRSGKRGETILQAGDYRDVALSPDSRRLAFHRHEDPSGGGIWVKDLVRGSTIRFTSHDSHNMDPAWRPDGTDIAFASDRGGGSDLYLRPASGTREDEVLLKDGERKFEPSWSADSRFLVYQVATANQSDIWTWKNEKGVAPQPYIRSSFREGQPRFSPDGRWIAYVSNESGRDEVYVQPFPANGDRYPVSVGGGREPSWRADGGELFFMTVDGLVMAVTVKAASATFEAGLPQPLFQINAAATASGSSFQPSADGQRFVIAEQPTKTNADAAEPLTVVLNWVSALPRPQ